MPKRSKNQITKEYAEKIIDKLDAKRMGTGKHTQYVVYHNSQPIASFGFRHGSKKNLGHDYIPRELGVGPNFAKQIAQCSKYKDDYIEELGLE